MSGRARKSGSSSRAYLYAVSVGDLARIPQGFMLCRACYGFESSSWHRNPFVHYAAV